jgi:DNA-binding transcriptional ArsR family regulator
MFNALSVVSESNRQEILRLVWTSERSAGDIAGRFDTTFGAVSQHLRVLRKAGLVSVRKEGRMRYYRAERGALGELGSYLEAMWMDRLSRLKLLAESEEER